MAVIQSGAALQCRLSVNSDLADTSAIEAGDIVTIDLEIDHTLYSNEEARDIEVRRYILCQFDQLMALLSHNEC